MPRPAARREGLASTILVLRSGADYKLLTQRVRNFSGALVAGLGDGQRCGDAARDRAAHDDQVRVDAGSDLERAGLRIDRVELVVRTVGVVDRACVVGPGPDERIGIVRTVP